MKNSCKAFVAGDCLHIRQVQKCPGFDKCDIKCIAVRGKSYQKPRRMIKEIRCSMVVYVKG